MANEWKADYYVSIHHNAGINGGTGGGTIIFAYPGTSGKTKKAQEAIYKHAIARAGLKSNRSDGTITEDFYVLRKTIMSAKSFDKSFSGTYMATVGDLKLRVGADDKYDVIDSIPQNGKVGFVLKRYLV